jgi:di/tripeptidase
MELNHARLPLPPTETFSAGIHGDFERVPVKYLVQAVVVSLYVIEKMERETGLEPA